VTVEGSSACDDAPSDARWADKPTTFDSSESTQKRARIELEPQLSIGVGLKLSSCSVAILYAREVRRAENDGEPCRARPIGRTPPTE
jgi:hypothetical protein